MDKRGKIPPSTLRFFGAALGSIGFLLLAQQNTVIGSVFIGIGSVLIAAGGS